MNEQLPPHALRKLVSDAEPLLEVRTLGKYRILRELGRGAMGIVFEAEDSELRRRVALKVLSSAHGLDPLLRERFLREAKAAARLNHPHIAAVYDASDQAIAMQLVDGVPLSRLREIDRRQAAAYVRDAALAVHYAHEQGVIHRDLKPHNLLVEGNRVLVTDFGLAKETAVESSLSLSGAILGTPSYMPPEQAEGRVHDVDARSDVYSLGATLYDVLAGRPPFQDKDVMRLLRRISEEEPPALRSFARDVPRDLEIVVLKCLCKEKERRYATARELADDLQRWLDGKAVLAKPPTVQYRVSKFVQRHRGLVGVASLSVLAFVVIGFMMLNERAARRASSEAIRLSSLVDSMLADAHMYRSLGETDLVKDRLREGIDACEEFLSRHEVGDAHFLKGRLYRAQGNAEKSRVALDRALALDPEHVEARLERGLLGASQLSRMPPSDQATVLHTQVLQDLGALEGDVTRLRRVDVEHGRAELARLRGNTVAARKGFHEVQRLDPTHVEATIALSQMELRDGNADAALALAMSALDLYRGFGPAYLARSAAYVQSVGESEVERAVKQHELAAASQRIEGGDRSSEAFLLRGSARLHIDDVEGALADFTSALKADPSDALAYGNRGLVHCRNAARIAAKEQWEPALLAWNSAVEDYSSALTIDPHLAGAYNNRGVCRAEREWILQQLGRTEETLSERRAAESDFDAAIERAPRFASAYLNRARVHRRDVEEALGEGGLEIAGNELSKALGDVEQVLELKPDDSAAILERALLEELKANLLFASKETVMAETVLHNARTDFDRAVELAPEDARARGLRGTFRLRQRDVPGGTEDLRAALLLSPDVRLRH